MRIITYYAMVMVLTTVGMGFGPDPAVNAARAAETPEEDFQVLASGPIHEAFAEAVTLTPEAGIVVLTAPPDLIEEIPPEQKPDGNVQWITGYWAWDDEREEYIWISGVWRVPPPGRKWVPGYWLRVENGYQWVSGYWGGVEEKKAEFLPEPPESLETGPNRNAPSEEYTWIPGCWVWHHGRYAWRPGYWAVTDPDWIWVPSHYNWTPRGYISVGGYWDYTIGLRGVLFAPVFFPRIHLGLSFAFSPGFVIDLGIFDDALFLRPRYCHYYFGDYYATRYYKRGIYPWFSVHARHVFYDPIYVHKRWKHRHDRAWEARVKTRFLERRDMKGPRPIRSFDHRKGPDSAGKTSGEVWRSAVKPLDRGDETNIRSHRFTSSGEKEQEGASRSGKAIRAQEKKGQIRETLRQNTPEAGPSQKPGSSRDALSRSTPMDRSNEAADHENLPLARHTLPGSAPDAAPVQRESSPTRSLGTPYKSDQGNSRSGTVEQRPIGASRAPAAEKDDNPSRFWGTSQQTEEKVQQPGVGRNPSPGKNQTSAMERNNNPSRALGRSPSSESRELKPGMTGGRSISRGQAPGRSASMPSHR